VISDSFSLGLHTGMVYSVNMEVLPQLGIVLCTFIGASTVVVAEPLVALVPPLFLLGIRFVLAALLLGIAIPGKIFPLTRQSVVSGFIAGVGFGAGSGLLYLALPHVRAGKLTFLIALEVVLVPLLSVTFFKHALKSGERLALLPAVLGLWLITGDTDGSFSLWEIVGLLSAFAYSIYTIALSQLAPAGSVASRTFVTCLVISVFALSLSFVFESSTPVQWSNYAVISLAYLVVAGTLVRFLVQAWAQQTVSASFTALTFSAEPVFAISMSYIFLGERFTFAQSCGAICILVAVGLVSWRPVAGGRGSS
jgi:drug/metabolite transporter (DMT)-like permease